MLHDTEKAAIDAWDGWHNPFPAAPSVQSPTPQRGECDRANYNQRLPDKRGDVAFIRGVNAFDFETVPDLL